MLDVIGAGFGRTGTLSLKAALERLGFGPCHHMMTLLGDDRQVALWRRVLADEPADWDEVFAGFRSTVDWPGACYWREIADHYPGGKVILTVRDPDAWYASTRSTIYTSATAPGPLPPAATVPRQAVWEGVFGGRFTDREYAIGLFEEHNATVRREIAAERLLVFDVAQGWRPLCAFLDVPVPDEPFPHLNSRTDYADTIRRMTAR